MDNEFGNYLKEKRTLKGYTINQLSLYSGISAAQLSRIENGKRGVPKAENIKRIADALSVPADEMMRVAGYIDDSLVNTDHQNENDHDIGKRMKSITEDLKKSKGLNFMGEPLSDEAIESLLEAFEYMEKVTMRVNKKYIPKNLRKDKEQQ